MPKHFIVPEKGLLCNPGWYEVLILTRVKCNKVLHLRLPVDVVVFTEQIDKVAIPIVWQPLSQVIKWTLRWARKIPDFTLQ